MVDNVREFEIANILSEATERLEKIQCPIEYKSIRNFKKKNKKYSKFILFLSHIIKTTGDSGKAMLQIDSSIRTFNDITPSHSLKFGLNIGAIVLSSLDFFLIPAIYLSCYLLDGKAPISWSNNARWLYSALLLALTITALCVPAIAVAIAFTTASFSLALSIFLIGQTLGKWYGLFKEKKTIKKLRRHAELEMEDIQLEAALIHQDLKKINTEQELFKVCEQIAFLEERSIKQKELLMKLSLKETKLGKKIKKTGFLPLLDKSVGLSLSILGMVGLIVSLYFPMAGLGIITAVSVISLLYLIARFALPLIQSVGKWILSKLPLGDCKNTSNNELKQTCELNQELSTDSMLTRFFGSKKIAKKYLNKEDDDFSLSGTQSLFQCADGLTIEKDKSCPVLLGLIL
ncbi:coiled-coil protein [Legionella wadsworthii]|uniref:Coiled-coil protein n=2 Tax=Legionella wadsworthii TaxID=28088 RepID=A0A378LMR1_9GAMM|nr:coiled-coil protein [Legionella wadsworthii]